MSKVKNSINAWKNSLLDISKRNRAINYKPFKSSTVTIASPNIDDFLNTIETKTMRFVQVFNLIDVKKLDEEKNLYVTSKGMSFPKKDEYTEDEVSKIVNNYNHKNYKDTNIFTPYFDNVLTSKLRHLANQSRLFEEENALNILYIGVGMFEWYESLSSAIKYRSPLLFLPVELNQKTISDDFTLTLRENDLMINDALARLMKETFKVDLEFDFDSNLSLSENYSNYKNHLFSLTEANPGWAFLDELNLSIFKFSTISMVKDIEENLETIEKHALIRQLAGDKVKIKKTVDVSDSDIENKKPDEYYQALDADSSQMVAVEEAILGNSFVLQGPPGTGKSQTITNILTELIARGKKVLFVAEKKAALDVVFNNLKKIGLEDYAISLHNTQLDKKQTISELANSLKDRQGRYKKISEASKTALYNKYNHSKELLNSYGNSLIKPREPLHLNLYQLYSSYFSLSKYPELRFKIDNVEKLDNKFLSNVEITLKRLETIESQVGKNFDKSPWSSLKLLKDNYLILEEIDEYVNKLKTEFNNFLELATILSESLNIKLRDLSLDKLETISQLIDAFDDIKVKNEKVETAILNGEILLERDIFEYERLLNYLENNISNKNSLNNYDLKILDEDISMFLKIALVNKGFFRRLFSKKYKELKYQVLKYQKKPNLKYKAILNDLINLDKIKEIEDVKQNFSKNLVFKDFVTTNILELKNNIEILNSYRTFEVILAQSFSEDQMYDFITNLRNIKGLKAISKNLSKILISIEDILGGFSKYINYFKGYETNRLTNLTSKVENLVKSSGDVKLVIEYNQIIKTTKKYNLQEFVKLLNDNNITNKYYETYLRRFYFVLINYYLENEKVLKQFSKTIFDDLSASFALSDKKLIESASLNVRELVNLRTPNLTGLELNNYEVQTLLRESNKKRRIMPLRELFKVAPNLIMNLKPILMMSPLSVSSYLRSTDYKFDVVIFDEASQVHPENAVGALYRSNQFIIVGDSKQLPPTNFFRTIDDEELEDSDVTSFESILDIAQTSLKQISLKWHYRSHFEELIRPSNIALYGNLITFPTVRKTKEREGLEYERVAGIYSNQSNLEEAHRVIKLIYEHFDKFKDSRSLGIVTFNKKQTKLIESELIKVRRKKPKYEQYFNYKDVSEPFFIKNLENVQGDERDTIIISTTYGPNEQGRINMNFGPINNSGGDRRLNVAVSRAKINLIIVSSLSYTDIDLSRVTNEGPRFFRDILKYAENGFKEEDFLMNEHNLEGFTNEVYLEIKKLGYKVNTNVGASAYKMDLAIINPNDESEYLLGVELDGSVYNNGKTTRERDRLRTQVLNGRGWQVYRIWSTNWFNDKTRAIKALKKVIEDTLKFETKKVKVEDIKLETDLVIKEEKQTFKTYPTYQTLKSQTAGLPIYEQLDLILKLTVPVHIDEINKIIPEIYGFKKYSEEVGRRFREDLRTYGFYNEYEIRLNFVTKVNQSDFEFRRVEDYKDTRDFNNIHDLELQTGILTILKDVGSIEEEELYHLIRDLSGYKVLNVLNRNKIYQILRKMINNDIILKDNDIYKLK